VILACLGDSLSCGYVADLDCRPRPEEAMPQILDHVDLRVRDLAAATSFYDAFLPVLGAIKRVGPAFTTWRIPPPGGTLDDAPDNFGITEDPEHRPGAVRIAFKAPSREAVDAVLKILESLGITDVETDDGIYGADYYGVFFTDLDGNRLEVCVNNPPA
jgi:catechol 2,3-dioxygenase-like lactoylglutathione lyase family enzyme